MDRIYVCIDLKSFYASVECVYRNLDPLTTNLVVADASRTEKTICLAVSPSLKAYGIPGRCRLFEVNQKLNDVNTLRYNKHKGKIKGKSYNDLILKDDSYLVDYVIATPRMAKYLEISTKIYNIYLKYVASEDIHVYSIDEVFMDITGYLMMYNKTAYEFVEMIIHDVYNETSITATAGIGSNMYLAKVAMDIVAKKQNPDKFGVRIATLDEIEYRKKLWDHLPIDDFWRVGSGYKKRLESVGLHTMGDIARCAVSNDYFYNEDLLFRLFGVNAELLIDHAFGYEPTTMKDIKAYRPSSNSISTGQVLSCGYNNKKGLIVLKEMIELLGYDLISKGLMTNQLVLHVGYDVDNLKNKDLYEKYKDEIRYDHYGRLKVKSAHGSINLDDYSNQISKLKKAIVELYNNIVYPDLEIRRINITATAILPIHLVKKKKNVQLDIFTNYDDLIKNEELDKKNQEKENNRDITIIKLKQKYGKNSILKGIDLVDGATTKQRNNQIGGHKA